jgi:hypothetical protein
VTSSDVAVAVLKAHFRHTCSGLLTARFGVGDIPFALCNEVLKELAKIHDGAANYSTTLKDSRSLVEVNDGAAGDGAEDDGKEEQLNEVVLVTTTTKHEALARIVEGQVFIIRTRKSAIRH